MVRRCGRKPSGEEVSFSLRYSRITDRLTKDPGPKRPYFLARASKILLAQVVCWRDGIGG